MNRFQKKKNSGDSIRIIGSAVLVAAVLGSFVMSIRSVAEETRQQQKTSLEKAIRRDVIQCYAMEGHYPESIAYMEEYYGLTYDKEHFFVDYEVLGSNMMPDITVIEQEE